MFTKRLIRTTLMIGLGLIPAGLATAQEGERGDRPSAERRQRQELRRGRPDAEEMQRRNEAMRRQLEALQQRIPREQFEQLQRRLPNELRSFRWTDPLGVAFGLPGSEDHGLGLTLRPVPDVLRSHIDLPEGRGLVVDEIAEDSPAAGVIEPNDVLLSLGETPLAEPSDLGNALQAAEGDTFSVTLLRKGEEQTVEIDRPRPQATGGERYQLGVAIETPDDAVRAQLGLPEGQGVIVMGVTDDSAAAKAGLKPNDILLELGGEPIVGARELAEQVQQNGGEPVELTLLRDGEETTVEVTPEKRPAPPMPPEPPQPPAGMRFFGPGVMIDPETGELRRGPGGPGGPGRFRMYFGTPSASPELQRQLDEVLEQLKKLREEVDGLRQSRPGRRDRDGA